MSLKHASAYTYGLGFGILIGRLSVGQHTFRSWLLVGLVFTAAYTLDKRAQTSD